LFEHIGDLERAQPGARRRAPARSGSLSRDEEALAGVAAALGLERARCQVRRDPTSASS